MTAGGVIEVDKRGGVERVVEVVTGGGGGVVVGVRGEKVGDDGAWGGGGGAERRGRWREKERGSGRGAAAGRGAKISDRLIARVWVKIAITTLGSGVGKKQAIDPGLVGS